MCTELARSRRGNLPCFVLQLGIAAEVAIKVCVLAARLEVLWGDVFPRFQVHVLDTCLAFSGCCLLDSLGRSCRFSIANLCMSVQLSVLTSNLLGIVAGLCRR